jgi:hypothetical protein
MLRAFKFWLILLLLVIFGAGIYFAMRYYRNQNDLAGLRQYEKYVEMLKSDTYGGATPEETLKMFVEALKEGDVEKAALYFAINDEGNRDDILSRLKSDKEKNILGEVINVYSNLRFISSMGGDISRTYKYEDGDNARLVSLIFNGSIWKIER